MESYLILALVCFVAMVSPGPNFVLVTRNAISCPRRQALMTAFGIVCGCLIHATYCVLGLAFVITQSVAIFSVVKYLGAAYLIYIGVKSLISKSSKEDIRDIVAARVLSPRGAFLQGLLCNVLNPKLGVFLLSLFTQFISADATITQKLIVAGIFVFESAIYWPSVVLLFQTPIFKALFSSGKLMLDRLCGALLIYLGVRVALRAN